MSERAASGPPSLAWGTLAPPRPPPLRSAAADVRPAAHVLPRTRMRLRAERRRAVRAAPPCTTCRRNRGRSWSPTTTRSAARRALDRAADLAGLRVDAHRRQRRARRRALPGGAARPGARAARAPAGGRDLPPAGRRARRRAGRDRAASWTPTSSSSAAAAGRCAASCSARSARRSCETRRATSSSSAEASQPSMRPFSSA